MGGDVHRIVWRIGEDRTDRNDGGTIVILPILPIPNDTAVFGLTGEASARLLYSFSWRRL